MAPACVRPSDVIALSAASGPRGAREPEVEHLDGALVADHDVGGLHVAMDDVLAVSGGERVGERDRDLKEARERKRTGREGVIE